MWMFYENVNVFWKCLYGGSDSYQTCKSVWMSTIINVSVWFYVLKDWCRKDSGSRTSLFKMLGLRFVFYEKRLRNVKVKMEVFMGFATCLYYLKCFHFHDDDNDVYNNNHVHDDEIMQMLMMIKLLCLWASPLAQCPCYLKSFHFSLCIFAKREWDLIEQWICFWWSICCELSHCWCDQMYTRDTRVMSHVNVICSVPYTYIYGGWENSCEGK